MEGKKGKGRGGTKANGRGSKARNAGEKSAAFRIRLRGADNASLSMRDVREGLLEAARWLKDYDGYRARWVTLYLTVIDEDGREVLPDPSGEWTLRPYKSAADEFGV